MTRFIHCAGRSYTISQYFRALGFDVPPRDVLDELGPFEPRDVPVCAGQLSLFTG